MTLDIDQIRSDWLSHWPEALAAWSPFVQLHEPIWCETIEEEKKASLSGSFAMIRLVDHSVVISLRMVRERGLQRFSREILAHEIGHHVYCPADLTDNARLLSRMRAGLPGLESYAPMISNLYADLLINDRLQRSANLDMAGVYQQLQEGSSSELWSLYMRMYELLWKLPPRTLANGPISDRLNQDAQLGARLIRSYSKDWLGGGGRFACLCFPYVEKEKEQSITAFRSWCDAANAGAGGFPNGLAEEDDGEPESIIHPAEDPELSGMDNDNDGYVGTGRVRGVDSGHKSNKKSRGPFEYGELLRASGVTLSPREIASKYYREKAAPHLIPFPTRIATSSQDPLPEGTDTWEISNPLEQIDWLATLLHGTQVIPGITTRERVFGTSPGSEPEKIPIDLYLGVDCSGSMRDPATYISYPILAGAIMVLSALRVGARVKIVLSGEPGNSIATDGFIRDPNECLKFMTNYLGTGYAFGIHRLAETFDKNFLAKQTRPVHILIISDSDMFAMLNTKGDERMGWDVAREAIDRCGGGATYVLQIPGGTNTLNPRTDSNLVRMQSDGWNVHLVDSMEELLQFAKKFSRMTYSEAR